jgi:TonB family protein
MLELRSTTPLATAGVAAVQHNKQRQRLLVAIVLLLTALVAVLVKDRDFWFATAEVATTEDTQAATTSPVEATSSSAPQVATPAVKPSTTRHAAARNSSKRVALQPLTMEVVAGANQKVNRPAAVAATTAQAVQTASAKAPDYPLLGGQTSVQGSVLLQALIGADGLVEDMRILSGPSILVPAAREAVRQWRFKPFLQNGKPVETQARVTVNFSINVSNTTARLQPTSITSDGAI